MSLLQGEYIKHIEQCDDGWWSGVGRGGKTGLFPCLWFSIQAATFSEISFLQPTLLDFLRHPSLLPPYVHFLYSGSVCINDHTM
jgi:Variant SH3 domain